MHITRNESIRIGNIKFLNMFKTFVQAFRNYKDEKYIIWIDRNWLE